MQLIRLVELITFQCRQPGPSRRSLAILANLRFETCSSPTLPPTERLRAAALLSIPHSPVEVISPFFVAPRERKQIELRIGEMAFILGDGQQLGRQLSVMITVQIESRLICLS